MPDLLPFWSTASRRKGAPSSSSGNNNAGLDDDAKRSINQNVHAGSNSKFIFFSIIEKILSRCSRRRVVGGCFFLGFFSIAQTWWTNTMLQVQTRQDIAEKVGPLPCIPQVLEWTAAQVTKDDNTIPMEWRQFVEMTVSSLSFEKRREWIQSLNPVIIASAKTLRSRLEPRRCKPKGGMNNNNNIAIASITNGVVANIQEWLFYHLLVGVEKIILCDDSIQNTVEQDRFRAAAQPFVDAGYVHILNLHMYNGKKWYSNMFQDDSIWVDKQKACYNHIRTTFGNDYVWMGFFDTDEFVVPHSKKCLGDFLEDYLDYGGLVVQWKMASVIGVTHHDPSKSYFEQYRYSFPEDMHVIKSFVQPRRTNLMTIHYGIFEPGFYAVNAQGQRVEGNNNHKNITAQQAHEKIELRHYYFGDFQAALYEKVCGLGSLRQEYTLSRWRHLLDRMGKSFLLSPVDNDGLLPPMHDALLSGLYKR